MNKISLVLCCAVLGMAGAVWFAEANDGASGFAAHVVYNHQAKVYQLEDQTTFANQSLEQKLLTVQYISRHEDQLAANALP